MKIKTVKCNMHSAIGLRGNKKILLESFRLQKEVERLQKYVLLGERKYGELLDAVGDSGCLSLDEPMHDAALRLIRFGKEAYKKEAR